MVVSRLLFGGAVFVAAFLLFLGEPMAAKQLLPVFGGSAAVWLTCLVFFQLTLLAGYLYAHYLARSRARTSHLVCHMALLLAAVVSALAWARGGIATAPTASYPVSHIFLALALHIGLPFLVLGATSPLLQAWFSRLNNGSVPYGLFALSNLASLLALVLYPSVIEPYLTLSMQRSAWAGGVAMFALLSAAIAWRTRSVQQAEEVRSEAERVPWRSRLLWFLLPMAAAMQLSAVTGHLTSNIAAIPLLWVVPLAVYLVTFIVAFEFPRLFHRGIIVRFLVVMLAALGYVLSHADVTFPMATAIVFFLFELFLAAFFCHAETFRLRPEHASESTVFYLLIAAGGTTGSFLVGIAAPLVFRSNYDLSLSFLVTAVLALVVVWPDGPSQRLLWSTVSVLLLVLVFALRRDYQHATIAAVRNFYGSLRVTEVATAAGAAKAEGAPMRTLLNGSIRHGTQIFSPELRSTPTTYYAEDSGIGIALRNCCAGRGRSIGVVGLGAGTLAAYGRAGDRIRFYEIDPAVRPMAEHLFTYLRDSGAQLGFADGDARNSLAQEPPQGFDVLAIDAFSGDAIPLHLLTREAMSVYRRHLAPGGILAFHVSNRYVDLEPEVGQLALSAGMEARSFASAANGARGEFAATWVLVSADSSFFARPEIADFATSVSTRAGVRPWTDDYSSLLPSLRW